MTHVWIIRRLTQIPKLSVLEDEYLLIINEAKLMTRMKADIKPTGLDASF